jgi:parallel beta-helix repeat protein
MSRHIFCLILLILASVCWAVRIIVPDSFPTIHYALGESDAGDTVYVKNGTYKENITLVDNVTLLGENKEKTIIKGRRGWPVVVGADGAIINNFTITHGYVGILCKNTKPIITGNIIKDNRYAGIHAIYSLPEIANNDVKNNGKFGIFLHWVPGCNTSIHSNTITCHNHSGIYCYNRTDVLIVRNTFMRNKHYGVFARDSRNTRIFENTFIRNGYPFNQLAIIDNKNKIVDSLEEWERPIERMDSLHSYFGIVDQCQLFDSQGKNIPKDRDYFSSYFYRRHSEKIIKGMCFAPFSDYGDGVSSYKQGIYWDATLSFGRTLYRFPNFRFNYKALYVLANSFIQLGFLQCATKALNNGLARYPASSYVVLYNLAYLKIAFLEGNYENIERYYTLLQDYCLAENVQKEYNHIKKLSEELKNNFKDTLVQQSAIPDSNKIELSEFESQLYAKIMSKQNPEVTEALKEYKAQYDEKYRSLLERLYSSKIGKLNLNLNSENDFW